MDEDELSQLLSQYEQGESSVHPSQTDTAVSDFHYSLYNGILLCSL